MPSSPRSPSRRSGSAPPSPPASSRSSRPACGRSSRPTSRTSRASRSRISAIRRAASRSRPGRSCSASARCSRRSARARARSATCSPSTGGRSRSSPALLIILMGAVLAGFGGMLFQQERRLHVGPQARRAAGRRARRRGLRHRLDALRRADARRDPRPGRPLRPCARRRAPAGGLLARPGRAVPALGPALHARARELRVAAAAHAAARPRFGGHPDGARRCCSRPAR